MKVTFDTEGTAPDCPIADAGLATLDECCDCLYFEGMEDNEVNCSLKEPIQEEE